MTALRGIRDARQRATKIVARLVVVSASEAAALLHEIASHPRPSSASFGRYHVDLIRHRRLLERLGYEHLSEIYREASSQGWEDVLTFFRADPKSPTEIEELPETVARALQALTVGRRKELSRSPSRKEIEFLLFETEPRVLRELLLNPRVTERDVIRIVGRHQAAPEILEEICRSDRWGTSYRVRKALCFNPRTPLAYAIGFVRQLRNTDLRLLLNVGHIRPRLIQEARRILN